MQKVTTVLCKVKIWTHTENIWYTVRYEWPIRAGFGSHQGQLSSHCCYAQTGCGAQLASYGKGVVGLFIREIQGRNVMPKLHHPTNADVKDVWSFTSTPPILFHDVVFNQAATDWRLRGSNSRRDKTFFFSTNHPDRLWGPNEIPSQGSPEFLH